MANDIEIRVTSVNSTRGEFQQVERDSQRLGQQIRRHLAQAFAAMVADSRRAAEQTSDGIADAFDDMADEAREGAREAGRALNQTLDDALGEAEQRARDAGEEIGDGVVRGAAGRMRDARGRFVRAGEDAGEGFGDGAEDAGGGRMRQAGGKLAGALKAAPWAAAGAAIGAVLIEGVRGALEAEESTAVLKAQLGEFGAEGEKLARVAGKLFRDAYGESLSEVNEAVGAVVTSIRGMRGASASAVEAMTAKALNLSKAFGVEVARSVQVVGQLVKSGLVKDANQGMDLLTAALQRVPAAVRDDLVDALDEYGPFMEQIGIKGERAFNILVAAADKGMFGLDKTGDAFKELTLKIASSAPPVEEALNSIGLTQANMQDAFAKGGEEGRRAFEKIVKGLQGIEDPGKRAETAIALFGTPLEDLNTKDIPAFLQGLISTQDALGKTSGAAKEMGDSLHDTASSRLTSFGRTLKGELVDFLGGPVLEGLQEFTDGTRDIFEDWLEDHSEVTESAQELWDKVRETFGPIFEDLTEWVEENRGTFEEWGDALAEMFESVSEIVGIGLDLISGLWEKFGPTILEVVLIFIDTLVGWWRGLFRTLKGVYNFFAGLFTGDWERLWEGLKDIASGLGEALWSVIKGILRLIWATFKGTWRLIGDVVEDAFDHIKKMASRSLDWVIGKFRSFFERSKDAFHSGVGAIRKIWGGIQNATKRPVEFVVDVVYNKGIRTVWNFVAGIAGMKKLDPMRFKRGGILPGYSAEDDQLILARSGEGIIVPEAVQSLGPRFIHAVNRAGARAKDVLMGGDLGSAGGRIPGFRDGGIVGRIKDKISDGVDMLKNAPKLLVNKGITAWSRSILDPLIRGNAGGTGWWGQAVRTMPGTMAGQFLGWIKKHLENIFGIGGGGFGRALQWARTQDGKPYQWGGNGNPSWDCSGFMSAIESVIRGEKPHRRWSTHPFHGGAQNPMPGWHRDAHSPFMIGVTGAGVGHTAGTLNGIPVESSGGGGVQVGGGARSHRNGMFPFRYGFRKADNGMIADPGFNTFFNATGAPEELRPVDQIPEVHVHVHLENHGVLGSRIDVEDWLTGALDSLRKQGRLDNLVQNARGTR